MGSQAAGNTHGAVSLAGKDGLHLLSVAIHRLCIPQECITHNPWQPSLCQQYRVVGYSVCYNVCTCSLSARIASASTLLLGSIRHCTMHDLLLCCAMLCCAELQGLWQQLASVTALVFAAALRRIQEVQAQMDLQPRWVVIYQTYIESMFLWWQSFVLDLSSKHISQACACTHVLPVFACPASTHMHTYLARTHKTHLPTSLADVADHTLTAAVREA